MKFTINMYQWTPGSIDIYFYAQLMYNTPFFHTRYKHKKTTFIQVVFLITLLETAYTFDARPLCRSRRGNRL